MATVLNRADEPLARLRAAYESAMSLSNGNRESVALKGHIRAALTATSEIHMALTMASMKANA